MTSLAALILIADPKEVQRSPILAQEVRSACKKGWEFADFAVTDYGNYIKKGTVSVTCIKRDENGFPVDFETVTIQR